VRRYGPIQLHGRAAKLAILWLALMVGAVVFVAAREVADYLADRRIRRAERQIREIEEAADE
jgi:hypothetical protein